MNNEQYLFCNVPNKTRPRHCFYNTNLCCYNCKSNKECQKLNEEFKNKPCTPDELESDEICTFQI